jgi:L-arabinokinase
MTAGKSILFYISGHGFGHASREVEIVRSLLRRAPATRIVIRTSVSPELLSRTLDVPFDLRPGACDTGIIQHSSITHDDEATVREAVEFYGRYDDLIERERASASAIGCDLIVSDIAPVAFEVGRRLGIPTIAISNFTWDWIYETHPGMIDAAPWLPDRLRQSYRTATLALELPYSGGFEVFPRRLPVPLVAPRPTQSREDTRRHFGLPLDRPVALLSFGGYGLPGGIDFARIDCLDAWTIATTDRTRREGDLGDSPARTDRVHTIEERAFLNSGFRYEDLVAAADVVVTKPGYGVVAECTATGTAMLYTSRGVFREYDVFVREMPRYVRARFIAHADLLAGRWLEALEGLMRQPDPPERMEATGADEAAEIILASST